MSHHVCAVGRTVSRALPYRGVDCLSVCRVPVAGSLPFDPPMYLCQVHMDLIVDDLYERMLPQIEQMGWIVG